nr:hypothetical protein [Tanacetum cinerariifolium]
MLDSEDFRITYTDISSPFEGYIPESDPEKDEEDPEEDPTYYPADREDDDREEEFSRDDADEDEDKEHPASANSIPPPPVHRQPIDYNKHALWGVSHWGRKRKQFYGYAVNRETARDVYSKRRIIAVTELQIMEWHDYKHLDWISVRRDDDQIYKFKERRSL